MENFIRWYDGAVSPQLCEQLISWFEHTNHKVSTDTSGKRNTETADVPESLMNSLLLGIKPFLDRYAKLSKFKGLARYDKFQYETFAIKKYEIGDYHHWHTDSTSPRTFHRFLAIQIYLNTVDKGGCTEFRAPNRCEIKPVAGRVAFFPTAWTHHHRAAPPLSGPKYSMNGYLLLHPEWLNT